MYKYPEAGRCLESLRNSKEAHIPLVMGQCHQRGEMDQMSMFPRASWIPPKVKYIRCYQIRPS